MPEGTERSQVPESRAVSRRKTRLSLVWVIPIVAAVAGAWVAVTRILGEGPKITIVLHTAEGLEAGKTKIHYNGVDVGTITAIRLSDDHLSVVATAQMAPKTEDFLVEDTQFWVVRARISGATVSGLSTLISGSYLGMEIGKSKEKRRDFVALAAPPVVTGETPGRFFVLKSSNLGSLDYGTPLYFRRLEVGQVAEYSLDKDGQSLNIRVFVRAPYDQYVTPNTRFWQASGIDASLSASGITVQTQSLLSILLGGIAFETPATGPVLAAAEQDTQFTLYNDRTEALKPPQGEPQTYVLVFKESVRGLTRGASVEFRGIPIGEVTDIRVQIDPKTFSFSVPVTVHIYPEAIGISEALQAAAESNPAIHRERIAMLVERGLRAQLQTGSLLTGALFVSFDFFPDAPPVTIDWSQNPVQLPTVPGQIQAIEASVANIIKKLDQLPIQDIGTDLRKALAQLDQTLASAHGTLGGFDKTLGGVDKTLGNVDRIIEPNSVLGDQLGSTLQEVSRAAQGLRVLADYLERHPEALLRGKPGEAK
jgi:paraquat-inducible protein B